MRPFGASPTPSRSLSSSLFLCSSIWHKPGLRCCLESFKIYLVRFTPSKVSEKKNLNLYFGKKKRTFLEQLLFKHMRQKAREQRARLTREVWEPIFPPLASGWSLPGDCGHGPSEAPGCHRGSGQLWRFLVVRGGKEMSCSAGGCPSRRMSPGCACSEGRGWRRPLTARGCRGSLGDACALWAYLLPAFCDVSLGQVSDLYKYGLIQSKRFGCLNRQLLVQMVAAGPLCLKKGGKGDAGKKRPFPACAFLSNTHSAFYLFILEQHWRTTRPIMDHNELKLLTGA